MKFFIFIFLITGITIGQNKQYDNIHSLAIHDSIKSIKIDSLLCNHIDNNDFLFVDQIADKYSIWHYQNRRVSKAIEALLISIQHHQRSPKSLQRKYQTLGQFYRYENQYENSIDAYKKGIKINADSLRTIRLYSFLGFAHYYNKDYSNSQQCFEVSEQGFRKVKDTLRLIRNHITSFNTYTKIDTKKSHDKSIKNLLEADSLVSKVKIPLRLKLQLKRALLSHFVGFKRRN